MTKYSRMVELAKGGMPPREIARVVGSRPEDVYANLSKARRRGEDVPLFGAMAGPSPQTVEILDLARAGVPPREIADRFGVSSQNVNGILRYWRGRVDDLPKFPPPGRTRAVRVRLKPSVAASYKPWADARGMTVQVLAQSVLEAVAEGDLVNAVLDDGGDDA